MIDTHAHLNFEAFNNDIDEVIHRAKAGGVEFIIVPGVEPENLNSLLEFAKSDEIIYCAMGVHPHNAKDASDDIIKLVEHNSYNNKVVGIGEIGLDYYYDFAAPDEQKKIFRKQIRIAKERNLPVIVHNRKADDDIYNILKEEQDGKLKGVLHCFSGGVELLNKAIELGFHISFTGNITFKNVNLDDAVKNTPLDKLLLETDSPFMTPVPFRGKRNEPLYVKFIAEKIAELKNKTIDEVISMTTANAKRLFGLMTILICLFLSSNIGYSQSKPNYENDTTAEEYENPYHRFIGIGPVFGLNTIVEEYKLKSSTPSVSYEGLFTYGGSLFYGLLDYCVLEATYLFFKNTKITEQWPTIEPYTYNIFELSSNWLINPYSRVNLYGTLGYTAIFSTINKENKNASYLNFGIGFFFNLSTNYGLINFMAEWKLNYIVHNIKAYYPVTRKNEELSHYFSIPRFGVIFYPNIKF